jgi:hypothetical protein
MIRFPVAFGKLSSWASFSALMLFFCAGVAWACKTPVYRYSLYNWKPSVYRVYYLHAGNAIPEADTQTNTGLTKITAEKPQANLEFHAVRTDDLDELEAEVRNEATAIIEELPAEKLPTYVVLDPNGNELHLGPIATSDAAALVDSPIRREINERIEQGHAAVLLLVTGKDAQANARAEKEVAAIVQAVAEGKIVPPKLPGDDSSAEDASADEPEPAAPPPLKVQPLKVASLKLDRDDPKERWLVRCLLQVESDLADIEEPMVFAIYGQCRANPPLVGDGIDSEQLTKQVMFVLGPCTCTIKEQNVGLDLLTRFDWQAVALSLAKRVGPETGNEHLLGADAFPNLFPKLHDPPAIEVKPPAAESAPAVQTAAVPTGSAPSPRAAEFGLTYRLLGLGILAAIIVLAVVTLRVFRASSA